MLEEIATVFAKVTHTAYSENNYYFTKGLLENSEGNLLGKGLSIAIGGAVIYLLGKEIYTSVKSSLEKD